MNLFDLFVKIDVEDKASGAISKITSGLGSGLQKAAKVGVAAIASVTTTTIALGAAMTKGIKETAAYGDNIDKMSQKMGLSAEAYQEWDFIMQHSGTSIESLQASMKTLANAVDSGNDAFERLGISQSEIAEMNQEELFAKTIEQLQKVEDTTERTYLAGQLLGRGATELGALLNTSAEDTEAMRRQVHELGGVMSNEAVKSAAMFQDSLQNMNTAVDGLKRNLMSKFLPATVSIMDGLAAVFSGDNSGIGLINEGINEFIDNLTTELPKFLDLGASIISSLAEGLLRNADRLFRSGVDIVMKLINQFINAVPDIVIAGAYIIESVIEGMTDAIPDLLDSIPTIIEELVGAFSDLFPEIITVAVILIQTLAEGLANNVGIIINAISDIMTTFYLAIYDPWVLEQLLDAALILVVELVKGLVNAIPNLIDAALQLVMNLIDFILNEENLNAIIDAALEIILVVSEGLVKAIPQLVDAAIQIIEKLVEFFLDPENIAMLLEMAFKIVVAIVEGLGKAAVELVKGAGKLIGKLVDVFKETDWKQLGKNIVDGLLNGLKNTWETLKKWFTKAWDGLVGGVKDLLGIHSPSRVFAGIGKNMALGVGEGWEDEFGDIQGDIDKSLAFDDPSMSINASVRKIGAGEAGGAFGGTSFGDIIINIDGARYSDEQSLASAIALEIQNMTDRRAAVYA